MEEIKPFTKICVVGPVGTNRSGFTEKCCNKAKNTIGVDFYVKTIVSPENPIKHHSLQFWDFPGQEKDTSVIDKYFKDAKGAFVMINSTYFLKEASEYKTQLDSHIEWNTLESNTTDLTNSTFSFDGEGQLFKSFESNPVILLIDEADSIDSEYKTHLNLDSFCAKHKFHSWYFISTKTGENIDKVCAKMIEILDIIKPEEEKESASWFWTMLGY